MATDIWQGAIYLPPYAIFEKSYDLKYLEETKIKQTFNRQLETILSDGNREQRRGKKERKLSRADVLISKLNRK